MFYQGLDTIEVLDPRTTRVVRGSARSGPAPRMMPGGSLADELNAATECLNGWLAEDDGPDPENIAILVRDKFQRERVVAGLTERGINVRGVERGAISAGRPVVMTMHRAKGLEFARVLLFGIRDGSIPAQVREHSYSESDKTDALLRERSLLYVAATRARDVLTVSWSGTRSTLLSSFEDHGDE